MRKDKIKLIAFDADDTLWVNEQHYRNAERRFEKMMERFCPAGEANAKLLEVEKRNLPLLGYGTKPFIISLIECGIELSKGTLTNDEILQLISIGKSTTGHSPELYPDAEEVIKALAEKYPLSLLTKGDLLEQESKIARSGIESLFTSVEIMSEKNRSNYARILKQHSVAPDEFVMVGNSFRSDIEPVLDIGGWAVYIPSEVTWAHEIVPEREHQRLIRANNLKELLNIF